MAARSGRQPPEVPLKGSWATNTGGHAWPDGSAVHLPSVRRLNTFAYVRCARGDAAGKGLSSGPRTWVCKDHGGHVGQTERLRQRRSS